jgi:hypothetical protein
MTTYLEARGSTSLASGVWSIALSLLMCRSIRMVDRMWLLLVAMMWIFLRLGVVDDRTT